MVAAGAFHPIGDDAHMANLSRDVHQSSIVDYSSAYAGSEGEEDKVFEVSSHPHPSLTEGSNICIILKKYRYSVLIPQHPYDVHPFD